MVASIPVWGVWMKESNRRLTMHEPAVYCIRVQGKLDESWSEYFGAQSISCEQDGAGNVVTVIISEPLDQGALVGLVNHLNGLGIPLISMEPVEMT
jgi:hypothetical protein